MGIKNIIGELQVNGSSVVTEENLGEFALANHTHNYAGSSSAGGNATCANKVAVIGRVSASNTILTAAANTAVRTEEVWFGGSDAVAGGMPMTYCIVVIKKGDNHRTILDCYHLNTGDHYINGCMDTRDTTANPWTGWKKQPSAADLEALAARVAALEAK